MGYAASRSANQSNGPAVVFGDVEAVVAWVLGNEPRELGNNDGLLARVHELEGVRDPHGVDLLGFLEVEEEPEGSSIEPEFRGLILINSSAPKGSILVDQLELIEGHLEELILLTLQKQCPEIIGSKNHLVMRFVYPKLLQLRCLDDELQLVGLIDVSLGDLLFLQLLQIRLAHELIVALEEYIVKRLAWT